MIYSLSFVLLECRLRAVDTVDKTALVFRKCQFAEATMIFPIKTLAQLPLLLKAFRKERGVTQAALAEKLGITQQSYAAFEANPATANLERVFTVLRLLDVDMSLVQATPAATAKAGDKPAVENHLLATPLKTRGNW
ncbi:MAG: helix-turn-helix transcriptional regulator [Azonexus sp.]|nr:helix-turn-helix transcriptional regulator [Azonexus sp.]